MELQIETEQRNPWLFVHEAYAQPLCYNHCLAEMNLLKFKRPVITNFASVESPTTLGCKMVQGRVCLKSTHLHLSHRVVNENYNLSVTLRHIASAQFKLLMSFNRQLAPANKKNCSCPCLPKCCPRNQTLDSGPYHGLQCRPWNGGDELALPDVPLAGDHRHHAMVSCQQNERT